MGYLWPNEIIRVHNAMCITKQEFNIQDHIFRLAMGYLYHGCHIVHKTDTQAQYCHRNASVSHKKLSTDGSQRPPVCPHDVQLPTRWHANINVMVDIHLILQTGMQVFIKNTGM